MQCPQVTVLAYSCENEVGRISNITTRMLLPDVKISECCDAVRSRNKSKVSSCELDIVGLLSNIHSRTVKSYRCFPFDRISSMSAMEAA